jgi:hypothetical protein
MSDGNTKGQETAGNAAGWSAESITSPSAWMGHLIQGLTMLIVAVLAIGAYHLLYTMPNQPRLATVDVGAVLRTKLYAETLKGLTNKTDAGRGEQYDAIVFFAQHLEQAVQDLQADCDCTLIVSSAVVRASRTVEDYTPVLKERLGMRNLDETRLAQQIAAAGGTVPVPDSVQPGLGMPFVLPGGLPK